MIIVTLIIVLILAIAPVGTDEIKNNKIEQVNETKQEQNVEFMYIPMMNGKTIQMILVPKIK